MEPRPRSRLIDCLRGTGTTHSSLRHSATPRLLHFFACAYPSPNLTASSVPLLQPLAKSTRSASRRHEWRDTEQHTDDVNNQLASLHFVCIPSSFINHSVIPHLTLRTFIYLPSFYLSRWAPALFSSSDITFFVTPIWRLTGRLELCYVVLIFLLQSLEDFSPERTLLAVVAPYRQFFSHPLRQTLTLSAFSSESSTRLSVPCPLKTQNVQC